MLVKVFHFVDNFQVEDAVSADENRDRHARCASGEPCSRCEKGVRVRKRGKCEQDVYIFIFILEFCKSRSLTDQHACRNG